MEFLVVPNTFAFDTTPEEQDIDNVKDMENGWGGTPQYCVVA
ncbi:hypothetical protein PIIN_09274 [Serendipita indica DSM 11827]|uniref:Uncharacterized protein n=1 Tax=Serendipita indica (strain DSM 11827) TaxID=1109443 RepID=G4TVE7_SERID|nr:hypothetical protein PIIN_09274 [Serendipita indica DSM 11827]